MIVVVCSVILEHKGKFLFVEEEKPEAKGKFGLPGGKLEQGETLSECAKRELLEETGYTVQNIQPIKVIHKKKTRVGNTVTKFIFYAKLHNQKRDKAELNIIWLTKNEVQKLQKENKIRGDEVSKLLDLNEQSLLTISYY